MKYEIVKLYAGNVEFVYGDNVVMLTDAKKSIIITDEEYLTIPKHKMYLFTNGFLVAREVIEEVKKKK